MKLNLGTVAMLVAALVVTCPECSQARDSSLRNDSWRRRLAGSTFSLPDGIWTSRGYGMVFNVTDGHVIHMEETDISCVPNDFILPFLDSDPTVTNGDTAVVTASDSTINEFIFDRSEAFISGCAKSVTPVLGDKDYTRNTLDDFDILAQTFLEHYAFFEERNINWNRVVAEHRAELTSNATDEELWSVLVDLVKVLDDPHVSLFNGEELIRSKDIDFEVYATKKARWHEIAASYMKEGNLFGDDIIFWGEFEDSTAKVGYIEIGSMDPENSTAFVNDIEQAIHDLQAVDTVVIDARFNLGGSDTFSFHIASLFASERVMVGRKHAKLGEGWTEWQEVYIEPFPDATKRYNGRIVVLTSKWTVSAAEVFIMAMKQLPQTTLLGRNTIGAFSDQLQKMMPNNWFFSLSNEVYEDAKGKVYEIQGIPPDVYPESDFLDPLDEEEGKDSWLDRAVEVAAKSQNGGESGTPAKVVFSWFVGVEVGLAFLGYY